MSVIATPTPTSASEEEIIEEVSTEEAAELLEELPAEAAATAIPALGLGALLGLATVFGALLGWRLWQTRAVT